MLVIALILTALGDVIAAIAPASGCSCSAAITGVGLGAVFACSLRIRSVVGDGWGLGAGPGIFAAMCSIRCSSSCRWARLLQASVGGRPSADPGALAHLRGPVLQAVAQPATGGWREEGSTRVCWLWASG